MPVPILMYHSVSDNTRWLWGHLSCPVKVFHDHVRAMAQTGFTAISLADWYAHLHHGQPLPDKPIILTFDDGYLDNWVYAFPILKRYGFKGTIFVNPDFVDPQPVPRLNLDDVEAGRAARATLASTGFLSWAEMSAMEASGVMDIQSHGLTHTWYFTKDRIVDFHHPGDAYPWLAWNARPERKHLWMDEDQSAFVPYGAPVYAHEKSCIVRRYWPEAGLAEHLTDFVARQGGAAFFRDAAWRDVLMEQSTQYTSRHPAQGHWESEHEYQDRVRHELSDSKSIIETHLHKRVDFLCWPGGGHDAMSEQIAREAGYLAMTLSSQDPRRADVDGKYITRWGAPTLPMGNRTVYRSGRYLVYMLNCKQGKRLYCLGCKALSAWDLALLRFR